MNADLDRDAALARLRDFAAQQKGAEREADRGSLERAADVVALYEDRRWVDEMDPPKPRRGRARPTDPESFSRFTKWLAERAELKSRQAYYLRDADDLVTTSLHSVQISPTGAFVVRPLKWMRKNDYGDHIPEVWSIACDMAKGTPDEPTVRKALSKWKHDNVPKAEVSSRGKRGGRAAVDRLLSDARKLMDEYPELFADALEQVEHMAEERLDAHQREMQPA